MPKKIKEEIEKYINQNQKISKKIYKEKGIKEVLKCIPENLKEGIKEVLIQNQQIIIKTTTPSWRYEINFLKKEIIKKIHKNFRNYSDSKITIL